MDGRIFIGGGEDRQFDYEILSPPYMSMARPDNLQWQGTVPMFDGQLQAHILTYGTKYDIRCDRMKVGVAVKSVVLTAPCSTTHHSDMHQRYVELPIGKVVNGCEVEFKLVNEEPVLPRGLYMLWLVTNSGAPSSAMWVLVQ